MDLTEQPNYCAGCGVRLTPMHEGTILAGASLLMDGYTLRWQYKKVEGDTWSDEQWSKLVAETKKIIAKAKKFKIDLAGPMGTGKPTVNSEEISLNGVGKLGHESFILKRTDTEPNFTKTNGKPYDAVVASILAAAQKINSAFVPESDDGPDGIKDGGRNGWGDGSGELYQMQVNSNGQWFPMGPIQSKDGAEALLKKFEGDPSMKQWYKAFRVKEVTA